MSYRLFAPHAGSPAAEEVTSNLDTSVALAASNIIKGTVIVKDNNEHYAHYHEGIDYEIDYDTGEIKVLSSGGMSDATTYFVIYRY